MHTTKGRTQYLHVCAQCRKQFVSVKRKQACCSHVCGAKQFHAGAKEVQTCQNCGKQFIGQGTKLYCSTKCRNQAKWARLRPGAVRPHVAIPTPRFGFWGI